MARVTGAKMEICLLLIQSIAGGGICNQILEPLDPGSAYSGLLHIYYGDILKIKDFKFNKLKSAFETDTKKHTKSSIDLFCGLPTNDQTDLEKVRQVHLKALSLVGPNVETIDQVMEKVLNADPSEQLIIIEKFIEGGRLIRGSDKARTGFLPFCWQITVLSVLDSCFIQIGDQEKIKILKGEVLPFVKEFKNVVGADNLWLIDMELYCKSVLCILESDFKFGYKTIEEFETGREVIFGKNDDSLAIPYYCRLSLLMRENKQEEVIQQFEKIPKNWLEPSSAFLVNHKIKFAAVAADAYTKLGKKEMAILWREIAFSYSFPLQSLAGKNYALKQAILLRNLYLEEKSWTLMRNLEERCAKFGMKPLPKQPGE